MSARRPDVTAGPGTDLPRDSDRARSEELFRSQYLTLVRTVWVLSGSREVAEDLVQDVFAQMSDSPRLAEADNPAAYVYQPVINRLQSWQRRQTLERRHARKLVERDLAHEPQGGSAIREFLDALSERQ